MITATALRVMTTDENLRYDTDPNGDTNTLLVSVYACVISAPLATV